MFASDRFGLAGVTLLYGFCAVFGAVAVVLYPRRMWGTTAALHWLRGLPDEVFELRKQVSLLEAAAQA